MNENGKRASGSPTQIENGVKRSRAAQHENNSGEYVQALERRVALLEQMCIGLKQV